MATLSSDDHRDLIDLVHCYAHAVDARSVAEIGELFADDARLEFESTGVVLQGRVGITEFFMGVFGSPSRGSDSAASTHTMTNSVATAGAAADTASIVTSAVAYHATAGVGDVPGQVVVRGLTYVDRCVRIERRWLISHRIHRLHWQGSMTGGPVSVERL